MKKWYLAGSMAHQKNVQKLVGPITKALGPGWEMHADWVEHEPQNDKKDKETAAYWAQRDYVQICECDLMIWIGGDPESSGKHAELGIAIAQGIPVVPVRPPWTNEAYRERCVFLAMCMPPIRTIIELTIYLDQSYGAGATRTE